MYPYLRLANLIVKSSIKTKKEGNIGLTDQTEYHFRANISDIDNYLEMNNGRILTLFDLGRTDLAIRTGLAKQLLKNGWGLVVAGSTVQYRKRVRAFHQVTIKTQVVAIDDKWFYVEQSMWVKNQCANTALLRTAVTSLKTGKVIPTDKVLSKLGYDTVSLPPNEWVQAWIDADKLRPFAKPNKEPSDNPHSPNLHNPHTNTLYNGSNMTN